MPFCITVKRWNRGRLLSHLCVEAVTAFKWHPQQRSEMVRQQDGTGLRRSVDVKSAYLTSILRHGNKQKMFSTAIPEGDIKFTTKSTTNWY